MPLPELAQGLVVRYEYLWSRRAQEHTNTGDKDRPVCVTVILGDTVSGRAVMLLPITHTRPNEAGGEVGVEIPATVKTHLGLDRERSWVIVSECNLDVWPSPDLRPIPRSPGRFHYGRLPPRLFKTIRDLFVETYKARRVKIVDREN